MDPTFLEFDAPSAALSQLSQQDLDEISDFRKESGRAGDIKEILSRLNAFPRHFFTLTAPYNTRRYGQNPSDSKALEKALPLFKQAVSDLMGKAPFFTPLSEESSEIILRTPHRFFRLMESFRFLNLDPGVYRTLSPAQVERVLAELLEFAQRTQDLNATVLEAAQLQNLPNWPFSSALLEEQPFLAKSVSQSAPHRPLSDLYEHIFALLPQEGEGPKGWSEEDLRRIANLCFCAVEERGTLYRIMQKTALWELAYYQQFVRTPFFLLNQSFLDYLPSFNQERRWIETFRAFQIEILPFIAIVQWVREFIQQQAANPSSSDRPEILKWLAENLLKTFPRWRIEECELQVVALTAYLRFQTHGMYLNNLEQSSKNWQEKDEHEVASEVQRCAGDIQVSLTEKLLRLMPVDFRSINLTSDEVARLARMSLTIQDIPLFCDWRTRSEAKLRLLPSGLKTSLKESSLEPSSQTVSELYQRISAFKTHFNSLAYSIFSLSSSNQREIDRIFSLFSKRIEELMQQVAFLGFSCSDSKKVLLSPPLFFHLMESLSFVELKKYEQVPVPEQIRRKILDQAARVNTTNEDALEIAKELGPKASERLYMLYEQIAQWQEKLSLPHEPCKEDYDNLKQLAQSCATSVKERRLLYVQLQTLHQKRARFFEPIIPTQCSFSSYFEDETLASCIDEHQQIEKFKQFLHSARPYFALILWIEEFLQPYLDGTITSKTDDPERPEIMKWVEPMLCEAFPEFQIQKKEFETIALTIYIRYCIRDMHMKDLQHLDRPSVQHNAQRLGDPLKIAIYKALSIDFRSSQLTPKEVVWLIKYFLSYPKKPLSLYWRTSVD